MKHTLSTILSIICGPGAIVFGLLSVSLGGIRAGELPYTPVVTPNGTTIEWKIVEGVKEFRLTVEEIEWEMAPGMKIKAWGYNGRTPGPTIEAVEGDRVYVHCNPTP